MLVRTPRPLRVLLTRHGTEISAFAEDGKGALVEAFNLLSMQTELDAGNKLTVDDEGSYHRLPRE